MAFMIPRVACESEKGYRGLVLQSQSLQGLFSAEDFVSVADNEGVDELHLERAIKGLDTKGLVILPGIEDHVTARQRYFKEGIDYLVRKIDLFTW